VNTAGVSAVALEPDAAKSFLKNFDAAEAAVVIRRREWNGTAVRDDFVSDPGRNCFVWKGEGFGRGWFCRVVAKT
jgi:hypothetical protein